MSEQATSFNPNTADAERICRWMRAGLDGYFERNMGRWAFRPLENYIGKGYDLAEDLRAIYQDVEPRAQGDWRDAIQLLLARQGPDTSKRNATLALIDFAALIRAHEVLKILPCLASDNPDLLGKVVGIAVALANQTDDAYACLRRLHTSTSFSPDYAGLVLVALCHVDPDQWLRHVENLAPAMNVLASRLEDDSAALRSFASRILDAITLSRLDHASLNCLASSSELAWLWHEWLGSSDSLLRYDHVQGSSPRVYLRDNDMQSIALGHPLGVPSQQRIDELLASSSSPKCEIRWHNNWRKSVTELPSNCPDTLDKRMEAGALAA